MSSSVEVSDRALEKVSAPSALALAKASARTWGRASATASAKASGEALAMVSDLACAAGVDDPSA